MSNISNNSGSKFWREDDNWQELRKKIDFDSEAFQDFSAKLEEDLDKLEKKHTNFATYNSLANYHKHIYKARQES